MKQLLLGFVGGFVFLLQGCSGTGFDKQATLMPDSITIGYAQEQYDHNPNAWTGFNASATWEFRKAE